MKKRSVLLIEEWNKRKNELHSSNKKFIAKIKKLNSKKLTAITLGLHDEVFEELDCLDCANCCKSIPPIINETDAKRVARHLGLKITTFKEQYIKVDEDMDMVMNQSPCPFLQDDNKCSIYEARPRACREYPHTEDYDFSENLKLHATNAVYCPAVFHLLENLKKKL